MAYSEKSGNLFSAGLDGKILMLKLEQQNNSRDINLSQEFSTLSTLDNSIFSIDCDLNGDFLLASVYENVNL